MSVVAFSAAAAAALQGTAPGAGSDYAEAELEMPVSPDAAALGHHGVVTLEGDIAAGRSANLVVTQSSRSPLLDAAALQKFSHAKIGADLLAGGAKKIRLKIDFKSYDFDNMGVGYLCGQAVLDADWYARTFPERPIERNKFKTLLRGMGLVDKRLAFAQDQARFDKAWLDTIDACRSVPKASVMGVIILLGNGKPFPK